MTMMAAEQAAESGPRDAVICRERRFPTGRRTLILAVALVLALGMVYYYRGVLIPLRQRQSQLAGTAAGNYSDLYSSWLAGRELLEHGRNPYSPEMTQEIQRGFYGRVIDRGRHNEPMDVEAFAYPVYVVFLLAPLLPLSFAAARVAFFAALFLATAASLPLWMRALGLRLRLWAMLLAWIAVMSSLAVVDGLHLVQITLLVAFLTALSLAALASGRLFAAGVLMALATVKPHLIVLAVAFILIWTVGEWHRRKWFVVGFGSAMAVLLIASGIVLPGWFRFWLQAADAFVGYHKPSVMASLLGHPAVKVVATGAVIACGWFFWRLRKESAGSSQFNFALVTALVLTALLLPNAGSAYYNQAMLLPVCLWVFTAGRALARKSRLARLMWLMAANALAWQWILALAVAFGAFVLRHSFEREATLLVAGPEMLAFFVPLALALFVLSVAPHVGEDGMTALLSETKSREISLMTKPSSSAKAFLLLLAALVAAAGVWLYAQRMLIPYQIADAAAHGRPRGNLSDLYPRWVGARELLLHGRDPYGPDVTHEIQRGYYGRPLDPARAEDPRDQQGFAYPVYVVFELAPTVRLPFEIVERGFFWTLLGLTAINAVLWLRALGWPARPATYATVIVLTLGSLAVMQGVKLEQMSLLVAGLMAIAVVLLIKNHAVAAGTVLALASVKPQLVLLLLIWLAIWTLADVRRRYWWAVSFLVAMGILFAASQWYLPHWIPRFWHALGEYRRYTSAIGLMEGLVGPFWGRVLELAAIAALLKMCWRERRQAAETHEFAYSVSRVLAVAVLVVPSYALYNQVLLIPAVLVLVEKRRAIWRSGVVSRLLLLIVTALVLWPWLASVALAALSFVLPAQTVERVWVVPFWTAPMIPVAVAAMMLVLGRQASFAALPEPSTS